MFLLLFLLNIVSYSEASRILAIYPVPSISHQSAFRPLTLELVKQGHEVTVITTEPMFLKGKAPANLSEIGLHDISNKIWSDIVTKSTGNKNDMTAQVAAIFNLIHKISDAQFADKAVKDIINNRKNDFDLLLIESCIRPHLAFTHIMKVPVIHVSSFGNWIWNYEIVGAPTHPLLYPTMTNQRSYKLTLWEKILEILNTVIINYITYVTEETDLKMMRKHFGEYLPNFKELMGNVDMLFLNVHPIWENNRPVPSSVVFMGGIHQKPPQELPMELKSYLDASNNGVIYMSFGTNAKPSLLPPGTIQVFLNVFSKLPYNIIWKWDKDELLGKPKNVRIQKWLPQPDLLRHPKVKLFITQGGLQSTDEAIAAGVPMIGIPMLADQWYNVENYVKHSIGLKLDINKMTEDILKDAIDNIVSNDSYAISVNNLRDLMYDQPQKPLDRAIWWIEHVLRHKSAKHLRSQAANMSFIKYIEVEVIAAIGIIVLILLCTAFIFVKLLINICHKKLSTVFKIKHN